LCRGRGGLGTGERIQRKDEKKGRPMDEKKKPQGGGTAGNKKKTALKVR